MPVVDSPSTSAWSTSCSRDVRKLLKIVAVVAVLLVGAAVVYWGALERYRSKATVDWPHDLTAAKSRAEAAGKPILVKTGARY